jgi:hypothetical protein
MGCKLHAALRLVGERLFRSEDVRSCADAQAAAGPPSRRIDRHGQQLLFPDQITEAGAGAWPLGSCVRSKFEWTVHRTLSPCTALTHADHASTCAVAEGFATS